MDALEVKATFSRIESTLLEMINLLKMESQRWATYSHTASAATPPLASLPPKQASAHEPPSPASAITTPPVTALVPPPVSAATPQPASLLLLPQPTPQQTPPQALKTVPKPVPPEPKTAPNQAPSTMPSLVQKPTPTVFRTRLKKTMNSVPTGMEMTRVTCVLERREWRPPWRAVVSAPTVGRLEWQPPWSVSRIMSRLSTLWARFLQVGGIVMCFQYGQWLATTFTSCILVTCFIYLFILLHSGLVT